jgi:hypothetical protein
MRTSNSSTGPTRRYLIFTVEEMKKEERSLSGTTTENQTRDGTSSILTKLKKNNLKD